MRAASRWAGWGSGGGQAAARQYGTSEQSEPLDGLSSTAAAPFLGSTRGTQLVAKLRRGITSTCAPLVS
jgi:hypothetical protein